MNVSVMQENLARGLGIVGRAVSSRATLPVLANVLLKTENAGLKLTATNLEIGINCWVPGKVEEEGVVPLVVELVDAGPFVVVEQALEDLFVGDPHRPRVHCLPLGPGEARASEVDADRVDCGQYGVVVVQQRPVPVPHDMRNHPPTLDAHPSG